MIYIQKNNLKKLATDIQEDINDFYFEIKKIEKILDEINSAWKGEDALNYINKMEEIYIPRLYSLYNNIYDYSEYIKNISNLYEIVDQEFYNKEN